MASISTAVVSGQLLSIQTGQVRPLMVGGRKLVSAIGKTMVSGPIEVGVLGLAGDEQADLSVHGGLSKAVYALPSEHLAWWQAQRQTRGATMFEETLAPLNRLICAEKSKANSHEKGITESKSLESRVYNENIA
jgi:hypothetical protein